MEDVAALDELCVIQQDLLRARHVFLRAFQFQTIGFQLYRDVQAVFQQMQVLIALAEKGFDVGQ